MGTRMAPLYATIFMGKLENRILQTVDKTPTVWRRYIDNIFAIWPNGQECLEQFIYTINDMHSTLKFTAEWSNKSVTFLDVIIFLKDGHIHVVTNLFTKPTYTHQYLHQRSCHPRHQKSTISYSQALRLRRICSQEPDYFTHTKELKQHLVARGYHRKEVQQYIDRATGVKRAQALKKSEKSNQEDRVPLVVNYHPNLPKLHEILRCHLPILHVSERMKQVVPN